MELEFKFWIVSVFLVTTDLVLTYFSTLKYGFEVEANLLARFLFNQFGNYGFLFAFLMACMFWILAYKFMYFIDRHKDGAPSIMLFVMSLGVYVIVYTQHIAGLVL